MIFTSKKRNKVIQVLTKERALQVGSGAPWQ